MLVRLDAEWRVKRAGCASSSFSNMAPRNSSVARLAAHARPYWATKPAAPRSANTEMMTAGICHSGSVPALKPLSIKGCISAGISGSVAAPTSAPAITSANPMRPLAK